ncbi:MAG: peptidoglycan editing factor PgeF, partial [Odoribacter sp.]|nr:peptidoglycan editing factor PgeF [Odoribacter sp.]
SGCPGVNHFVSSGAKNIGFSEEADADLIRQNRLSLAKAVGFEAERLVTAHQVHSARVGVVIAGDAGRGALDKESRLPDTDALVTAEAGVCLMVLSADCVPVLLYDPVGRVVAAVHAGWRGTVARIVVEAVEMMKERFGSRPEDVLAGIGPSIGKCCFEVDEEVAARFRCLFPEEDVVFAGKAPGKFQVDLWEANRKELLSVGLKPKHIEVSGMCSVCHPGHFFSYRRDGKAAGRFGAGIVLNV